MLKIREEHKVRWAEDMEQRFKERLRNYLRRTWPEVTSSNDDHALNDEIETALQHGKSGQLQTEQELASFTEYVIIFGLDPESPENIEVLDGPMISKEKLEILGQKATSSSRKAV